ncbi:hypothetical protein [Psychromonas aquimarina]|uniref:hypothetical protein n=1 Tax=Psychromonas aquimarina TaxID=444919 RepID=UPI0003F5E789|nr:hypothetical protein [Psychromonas aquimarina]
MSTDVRQKMYDELRDELYKRELSNSESFDKAILSLSSAGLAISLTFIKSIVAIDEAIYIYWLYSSWVFFGMAIILTLLSLMFSNQGMKKQLDLAERYYLLNEEDAFNKPDWFAKATELSNLLSGIVFIFAISSVIVFSIANFSNKNSSIKSGVYEMSDSKKVIHTNGQSVPQMKRVYTTDGATIPKMQKTPEPTAKKVEATKK